MKNNLIINGLCLDINEKNILNNISFELEKGKIAVLLGPNGSGKTTLLKALNGLMKIKQGEIFENGYKIQYLTESAMVFDEPVFYEELTGKEQLKFVFDLSYGKKCIPEAKMKKWINELEMEKYMNHMISTYSLGTKKKLQFLCALVDNPQIILMDEYISGLDPQILYAVKQVMRDYAEQGNIILLSTHMLDMAERFCDEVILIRDGRIVGNGKEEMRSVLDKYGTLEKYYLMS